MKAQDALLSLDVKGHAVGLDFFDGGAIDVIALVGDVSIDHGYGFAVGIFHDAADLVS